MFHLAFLILFASGFTLARERHLLCRSTDLDVFYSYCGPSRTTETFLFRVEPCSLKLGRRWNGTLFWIPKRDLIILKARIRIWYATLKVLEWKAVLCTGAYDDYSFCGTLKGQTVNTTMGISNKEVNFPKGEYSISIKAFTDHSEDELTLCMNYTLILKP